MDPDPPYQIILCILIICIVILLPSLLFFVISIKQPSTNQRSHAKTTEFEQNTAWDNSSPAKPIIKKDEASMFLKTVKLWVTFENLYLAVIEKQLVDIPSPQMKNSKVSPVDQEEVKKQRKMNIKRTILSNVTGFLQPGTLTCIMGPSGCGKTSILDILSGRNHSDHSSGTVLVNGLPRNPQFMKRVSGYVLQSDVLFSQLTVRETLLYTIKLRCSHLTQSERTQRIDQTMTDLELSHVADTKVGGDGEGGLSGGQKRRLSIAIELVTSPGILMLDEPTTYES
jgi:ABC-type lipoprotein export system ATPase subunit